jgi:transposase
MNKTHLTSEQLKNIFSLYEKGMLAKAISQRLNLHYTTVYRVLKGLSYKEELLELGLTPVSGPLEENIGRPREISDEMILTFTRLREKGNSYRAIAEMYSRISGNKIKTQYIYYLVKKHSAKKGE